MDAQSVVAFLPDWLQPYLTPDRLTALATASVTALATLFVGWLVARWVGKLTRGALERAGTASALAAFLSNIVRYLVIVATFIAAAEAVGFQTTSLMAIFASAGLAIGLALQGSLSNFAAGVMILFFRPFGIDDWITVGGLTAKVTEIGLFATSMMKNDGTKVVVPNGSITGSVVENHTELDKRRATVNIGVEYGCDLQAAREALVRAVESVEGVLPNAEGKPDYVVYFASFGGSSLDFQIHLWTVAKDFLPVQEQVRYAVYRELAAAGIGIPFPQLDVHFDPGAFAGKAAS